MTHRALQAAPPVKHTQTPRPVEKLGMTSTLSVLSTALTTAVLRRLEVLAD
ncbi:hypothetical protein NVS55_00130 [Myxococcus stipitatus]|uniref:hypothetical protein n=1 Tax=Myxococcus stipitatus TaxID=83455 RepID=UPI0031451920